MNFSVGDTVEARFQGGDRFYKGRVMRTPTPLDPTYEISYDDGDVEEAVRAAHVRACPSAVVCLPPTVAEVIRRSGLGVAPLDDDAIGEGEADRRTPSSNGYGTVAAHGNRYGSTTTTTTTSGGGGGGGGLLVPENGRALQLIYDEEQYGQEIASAADADAGSSGGGSGGRGGTTAVTGSLLLTTTQEDTEFLKPLEASPFQKALTNGLGDMHMTSESRLRFNTAPRAPLQMHKAIDRKSPPPPPSDLLSATQVGTRRMAGGWQKK